MTRATASPVIDGLLPSWLRTASAKAPPPPVNPAVPPEATVAAPTIPDDGGAGA
ncbi:hypothetical protein [Saccharothrix sp. ST-888]|uniref:hypothetical protein n=1 Tax=Saccharothrix sp. ST-888 TaxID=1427391 RepID=UPI0018CF3064|nr:hypothetical protein [Saccharothrix sp. ST-888]